MITLYLVNQPESTWMKEDKCEGQSDTSLTALGKSQSKKIGEFFKDKHISALYSSNLHRANQCAKIISSIVQIKVKREEKLAQINLGIWQGKYPEEIESRYPRVWQNWKAKPSSAEIPGGEHLGDVLSRVSVFLSSLCDDELFDKNIIIVTHDIIIRIILLLTQRQKLDSLWEYHLDRASISEVQIEPEKKIIQINDTSHLYVPSFN